MRIGSRVYGLGAIAMGVSRLVFHTHAKTPGADHSIVYVNAAILILGGAALNLPRLAKWGAGLLAGFFVVSAMVQAGPGLIAMPLVMVNWQNLAELLAAGAGGVVAFALSPGALADGSAIARAGRLAFGACLLVFGASHFVYAKFTAGYVPAWIPPGQVFWTYVTGAAQIAAGLALLSGIQARLAAVLLTVMYALFALLVHTRLILADPHPAGNWDELCETLVLMGAAWTMADSARRKVA
jgi:uncharacterized membrane protein